MANRLSLNVNKTKYMIFHNTQKDISNLSLNFILNHWEIETVSTSFQLPRDYSWWKCHYVYFRWIWAAASVDKTTRHVHSGTIIEMNYANICHGTTCRIWFGCGRSECERADQKHTKDAQGIPHWGARLSHSPPGSVPQWPTAGAFIYTHGKSFGKNFPTIFFTLLKF